MSIIKTFLFLLRIFIELIVIYKIYNDGFMHIVFQHYTYEQSTSSHCKGFTNPSNSLQPQMP